MKIEPVKINSIADVILDDSGVSPAYFSLKESVAIDQKVIQELYDKTLKHKKDLRLCMHSDSSSTFHNMIIVQYSNNFHPPHKHPLKAECYHIIKGKLGAIHFNDNGVVTKTCELEPDGNFIYRIAANEYHVVFPLSEVAIYHESKPGPFLRKEDFVEPSWSPNINNEQEVLSYTKQNHSLFKISNPKEIQ